MVGGEEVRRGTHQNGDSVVAVDHVGVVGPVDRVGGEAERVCGCPEPKLNFCLGAGGAGAGRAVDPRFLHADDVQASRMTCMDEGGNGGGGSEARDIMGSYT